MANRPGGGLLIIERILRDRASIWRQVVEERDLRELIAQMLSSSAISLALYGAVLGASYGWQQSLSSLIKLPLLFLATLAICLPTLYLFNLVFGSRLSVVQAVALIMVAITVTSVLTLAFAPISLFFLVTAQNYAFFKLLNVAILTLTAVVGLGFLVGGMQALNEREEMADRSPVPVAPVSPPVPVPVPVPLQVAVGAPGPGGTVAVPDGAVPAVAVAQGAVVTQPMMMPVPVRLPMPPPPRPRSGNMNLLYIWIVLFGFVGTQLAWTLRPFFGSPGQPFALFRHLNGTFYGDILQTIGHLLGN